MARVSIQPLGYAATCASKYLSTTIYPLNTNTYITNISFRAGLLKPGVLCYRLLENVKIYLKYKKHPLFQIPL